MIDPFWALYFTLLTFFGGACVGSFLNVCIHRIPRDESIVRPRSHCPACGTLIAWYDNLPLLSYFLLRGRCRACRATISPRYVLVEMLTAVLFLAVWNQHGLSAQTLPYLLVTGGLILATFVDFEHYIIPDSVSIGGMVAGPLISALVPALHGAETALDGALASGIGLVAGAGSLWLVAEIGTRVLKKEAMGFGDVKLLGAIGAFLGWQAVVFTILVSSLLGSVIGLGLIALRQRAWQSRLPYGPFLAAGALAWMLGGRGLWEAYLRWMQGGL